MFDFKKLGEKWPSALVAREQVAVFSGGLLHPRTMANLDSQGRGPRDAVRFGARKVAYPVESLVTWMESRAREKEV